MGLILSIKAPQSLRRRAMFFTAILYSARLPFYLNPIAPERTRVQFNLLLPSSLVVLPSLLNTATKQAEKENQIFYTAVLFYIQQSRE